MIVVERAGDGWRLPLEGFAAVGYHIGVSGADLFLVADGERSLVRISEDGGSVVAALAEARAVVETARVADTATLDIDFGEDGAIHVPAGRYETWEVVGPGRLTVVAPAGGGEPSIWDDTTPTVTVRKEQL
jgi:hypothetical protein